MASGKKVMFSKPRQASAADMAKMDEWVSLGAEEAHVEVSSKPVLKTPEAKVRMKRLSMDLPEEMHKDLMKYCVDHGTKASILVRQLLQRKIYR